MYFNSQLAFWGRDVDDPQTPGAGSKYNLSEIDAVHFNLKKHRIYESIISPTDAHGESVKTACSVDQM